MARRRRTRGTGGADTAHDVAEVTRAGRSLPALGTLHTTTASNRFPTWCGAPGESTRHASGRLPIARRCRRRTAAGQGWPPTRIRRRSSPIVSWLTWSGRARPLLQHMAPTPRQLSNHVRTVYTAMVARSEPNPAGRDERATPSPRPSRPREGPASLIAALRAEEARVSIPGGASRGRGGSARYIPVVPLRGGGGGAATPSSRMRRSRYVRWRPRARAAWVRLPWARTSEASMSRRLKSETAP